VPLFTTLLLNPTSLPHHNYFFSHPSAKTTDHKAQESTLPPPRIPVKSTKLCFHLSSHRSPPSGKLTHNNSTKNNPANSPHIPRAQSSTLSHIPHHKHNEKMSRNLSRF